MNALVMPPVVNHPVVNHPAVSSSAETASCDILVVDDDPAFRMLYKNVLQQHGKYKVAEAHDGETALAMLQTMSFPPRLIISDFMMPHLDGIAFVRSVRALRHGALVPVIMVSCAVDPFKRAEALAAGASLWLNKAAHLRDLMSAVRACLNE